MADDDSHFIARGMEPKDWQKMKSEVYRLYMVENNTLRDVQAQLQAIHGFQACFSKWKDMVKEWNFSKNFPESTMHAIVAVKAQHARKRKRTVFSCEGTPITEKIIENFEKKHRRSVAPPFVPALPNNIRYHTPHSEDEGESFEEETQVPSSSLGHACSVCAHQWEMEPGESDKIDLPDKRSIDKWLLDEHQPWSQFKMSYQLNHHDDAGFKDHNLSEEFREFGLPSVEYDAWPDLPNSVLQPFLVSRSIIIVEQEDTVSEEVALTDPSTLASKITQYFRQNQEHTPHALRVRFELAEALHDIGKHHEAEDHCRNLLAMDSQESVPALLATILARTGRVEESTTWLFIALTNFILDCSNDSLQQQNARFYGRIYHLFAESIWLSDQNWVPLTQTLMETMVTLEGLDVR